MNTKLFKIIIFIIYFCALVMLISAAMLEYDIYQDFYFWVFFSSMFTMIILTMGLAVFLENIKEDKRA